MAIPSTRQELIDWKPRTYYVFQNKMSGMMYIGQTTQDIDNYLGSGTYWKPHCKKHGGYTKDNRTIVESHYCTNVNEAQKWLDLKVNQYGEYWNRKDFANQIAEGVDGNPFVDHNPAKKVNAKRVQDGTHNFITNRTTNMVNNQLGEDGFKNKMLSKYGVDNIMKLPEVAAEVGAKVSATRKELGLAVGANNPKAKAVTINNISFGTIKEAAEHFGISPYYIRKHLNDDMNIALDVEELNRRTQHYGRNNQ